MTAAQKKNVERFKKAAAEAKKLRAKNKNLTQAQAMKKAFEMISGTNPAKKAATKPAKKAETHKDTKSHNVNIRVLSGTSVKSKVKKVLKASGKRLQHGYTIIPGKVKKISGMTYGQKSSYFTRVNNDVNGNPRYVIHFLNFINDEEKKFLTWRNQYEYALKKAKILGGKKFHNKQYGGGIVFQSYNVGGLYDDIMELQKTTPKIKI
jgi:hypothetical protein